MIDNRVNSVCNFETDKLDKSSKSKKTQNGKHASKKSIYTFQGDTYNVYTRQGKYYTPILKAILEVLYFARYRWKRVLVVRFELNHKDLHTLDNSHISKFRKNLLRNLGRAYNTKALYFWVREVGSKNEGQHYHFALFLDGNKVNHSKNVLEKAERTWKYGFSIPENPYYFINNQDIMEKAVYRLSYFAKVATKGNRKPEVHDFGRNQLKI